MKSNNWINPFVRVPENRLLLIGILCLLLAVPIAVRFDIVYDGLINIHGTTDQRFGAALLQQLIAVLVLSGLLWLYGKAINNKTRWVDMLTAVLVFRIPLYLVAFSVPLSRPLLKELPSLDQIDQFRPDPLELIGFSVMGVLTIGLLIYAIVLLVNGFKVATNAKKLWQLIGVVLLLLLADWGVKLLITRLYLS